MCVYPRWEGTELGDVVDRAQRQALSVVIVQRLAGHVVASAVVRDVRVPVVGGVRLGDVVDRAQRQALSVVIVQRLAGHVVASAVVRDVPVPVVGWN
jgi:hypothetical protein